MHGPPPVTNGWVCLRLVMLGCIHEIQLVGEVGLMEVLMQGGGVAGGSVEHVKWMNTMQHIATYIFRHPKVRMHPLNEGLGSRLPAQHQR